MLSHTLKLSTTGTKPDIAVVPNPTWASRVGPCPTMSLLTWWTSLCHTLNHHRLLVEKSSRHFTAFVHHNNGNRVVDASTKEFCVSRHLYKTSDCCAAYNIGRVVAHRCKNAGLNRVMWEHKWDRDHARVSAWRIAESAGLLACLYCRNWYLKIMEASMMLL